jgi:hypothetical protein
MGTGEAGNGLAEGESTYRSILSSQILRYPRMQVQDLYKLFHQGAMGSEHAVRDFEGVRSWLERELEDLQEGPDEPLIDPISHHGEIVRVNLRPYIDSGRDPSVLLQAFIKTANEFHGDHENIRRYWAYAGQMASEGELAFEPSSMEVFFSRMEKEHFPAVHHSMVYEEAYHPAYRVVALAYLPD